MYAWEDAVLARVSGFRTLEAQALHAFASLRLSNTALTLATPALCLLAMLTARHAAGREPLSLASTFTAVALVGTLQAPLSGVSEGLASAAQVILMQLFVFIFVFLFLRFSLVLLFLSQLSEAFFFYLFSYVSAEASDRIYFILFYIPISLVVSFSLPFSLLPSLSSLSS